MQTRPVAALALLLALACAGCSDDSPSDAAASTTQAATTAPTTTTSQPSGPAVVAAPFEMDGTGCKELLVISQVDVTAARAFVPPSYALLGEATTQTVAFAGLKHCADVTIDGVSIGPTSTSDVGVFIDKGEPGVFHYYQAWWTTNNSKLWERLAALGWHGGIASDSLAPLGAGPPGLVAADVLWVNGTYSFGGDVLGQAATLENHAVGWFDTPTGTMVVDKTLAGTRLGAGRMAMTAGGEAATLFGPLSTGPGLWNEYDMDGAVRDA